MVNEEIDERSTTADEAASDPSTQLEASDDAGAGSMEVADIAAEAAQDATERADEEVALADVLHEMASDEAEAGDAERASRDEALAEVFEAAAVEDLTEAAEDATIAVEALAESVEEAEPEALEEPEAIDEPQADVAVLAEVVVEQPKAEPEPEPEPPSVVRGPGDWYVVHTYSGYENKVKTNLNQRIASMQMEDKIFDVHIPMEDVMEIKGGKKQVVQRKVFPGYLLVRMIYDNDSWYVVRNTPGVTGFVSSGTGTKPTPLSQREVEKILAVKKETEKPAVRLEWEEGDVVRIVAGPFADFTGTIDEINVEQSKLRVMVNIFDRETPVELAFDQVAKA